MKRSAGSAALVLLLATACATTRPAGQASRSTGPGLDGAAASTPAGAARAPGVQPAAACSRVLTAAGDIVNNMSIADRTGRLAAAQHPDLVLVLGDNQYPDGSLALYRAQYDRTAWGALKPRTRPVPGNHEYQTPRAAGYFTYFGHPSPYYAYDAGCGWRAYALNSEIDLGPEVAWLRRDLTAHPGRPVVAYWHRPRWSSGTTHGSDPAIQPLWSALAGRRGVVLDGHEHNYERFAPIDGLREFVVGTGGSSTYGFGTPVAGSQRRIAHTPGVLRLVLHPGGYSWAFLAVSGGQLDAGTG